MCWDVSLLLLNSNDNLFSDKTKLIAILYYQKHQDFFCEAIKNVYSKKHYLINYYKEFTFVAKTQFLIKTNRFEFDLFTIPATDST